MERSGLTFEHFVWKWSKIAAQKKVFFVVAEFALVHPPMASVLLSPSVERCFVSRVRDFYLKIHAVNMFKVYNNFNVLILNMRNFNLKNKE